jgi:hypothetical protein
MPAGATPDSLARPSDLVRGCIRAVQGRGGGAQGPAVQLGIVDSARYIHAAGGMAGTAGCRPDQAQHVFILYTPQLIPAELVDLGGLDSAADLGDSGHCSELRKSEFVNSRIRVFPRRPSPPW